MAYPFTNLILERGGVKGIAYVRAMEVNAGEFWRTSSGLVEHNQAPLTRSSSVRGIQMLR